MKRVSLLLFFSLFTMLRANIVTDMWNKGQEYYNWLTHSTTTTKLHSSINAIRAPYCTGASASKKLFGGTSCDDLRIRFNQPPIGASREVLQDFQKYKTTVARVRNSSSIGEEEKSFIQKRRLHVMKSLPKVFGDDAAVKKEEHVPSIAICSSGGGFRAMIATLGLLEAMESPAQGCPGMMDCVSYMAVLSGSTWVTMPWCLGQSLPALKMGYKKYCLMPLDLSRSKLDELKKNPLVVPQSRIYPERFSYRGTEYFFNYFNEKATIQFNMLKDFWWEEPLSLVKIYGVLIAHMTLGPFDDPEIQKRYGGIRQARQQLLLSQAKRFIEKDNCSTRPLPIGTCVTPISDSIARKQAIQGPRYIWGEVTPYEIGFDYYGKKGAFKGAYIPTWASGRKFAERFDKQKKSWFFTAKKSRGFESTNQAPELTLGYWLGTFGSAFAVSPGDLIRIMMDGSDSSMLQRIMVPLKAAAAAANKMPVIALTNNVRPGGTTRLFPSEMRNYAVFKDSPFKGQNFITWVDAGISGNLPFYPLLRKDRNVDIIIALDSSGDVATGKTTSLTNAEKLSRTRGLPFPKIVGTKAYAECHKHLVTVFDEYPEGQSGPVIVYIPLIDSPELLAYLPKAFSIENCLKGQCSTFNFEYSPENIEGLSRVTKQMVWAAFPTIEKIVKRIIEEKRGNEVDEFDYTLCEQFRWSRPTPGDPIAEKCFGGPVKTGNKTRKKGGGQPRH